MTKHTPYCIQDFTFLFGVIPSSIYLIIITIILIHSLRKLPLEKKQKLLIKIIYIIACILTFIAVIIHLIESIICYDRFDDKYYFTSIYKGCYLYTLMLVLSILLLRLHFTFGKSMYQLPTLWTIFAIISWSLMMINCTTIAIGYTIFSLQIRLLMVSSGIISVFNLI